MGGGLRSHVVDLLLVLGHVLDVLCQGDLLVLFDRMEHDEVLEEVRILSVLVDDAVFQLPAEALVESGILLGIVLHELL